MILGLSFENVPQLVHYRQTALEYGISDAEIFSGLEIRALSPNQRLGNFGMASCTEIAILSASRSGLYLRAGIHVPHGNFSGLDLKALLDSRVLFSLEADRTSIALMRLSGDLIQECWVSDPDAIQYFEKDLDYKAGLAWMITAYKLS